MAPADIARLEAAVIEAVNSAIQEVTRRNAERLAMMAPDILAGAAGIRKTRST
jgi:hypothetical protein